MSIEKMSLVSLRGDMKQIEETLFVCGMGNNFHPNEVKSSRDGRQLKKLTEQNPYAAMMQQIIDIGVTVGLDIEKDCIGGSDKNKKSVENFVGGNIEWHLKKFREVMNKLEDGIMQKYITSDILALGYIKTRFGVASKENLEKLRAVDNELILFEAVEKEEDYCWCIYFTTADYLHEATEIMSKNGFHEIWLPTFAIAEKAQEVEDDGAYICNFYDEIKSLMRKEAEIKKSIDQYQLALEQVNQFDNLSLDFEDVIGNDAMKVRFGRLPVDSYTKLEFYNSKLFTFKSFTSDNQYHWGLYLVPQANVEQVDEIFNSLFFERIWIYDYIKGSASEAKDSLMKSMQEKKNEASEIKEKLLDLVSSNKEKLEEEYYKMKFLNESFELRKYIGVSGNQFYMEGFIPTKDAEEFRFKFEFIEDVELELTALHGKEVEKIPTKLKNNRFSAPFQSLVAMYGMPGYGDFDPTTLMAITYTLLYGIMFGDLGQGILLAIVGAVIWKKTKNQLGRIMIRLGTASALFGTFYGSVFGFEEVLDPLFINVFGLEGKPVHIMNPATTNKILIAAISLGCILIVISMVTNVCIGFKKKDYSRALFSSNGIAGVTMYVAVLLGAAKTVLTGQKVFTSMYIIGFVIVPLILIWFAVPLGNIVAGKKEEIFGEEGVGVLFSQGIFELFEVILSFVSNTMSFLRVGGFILSHAGMMLVVMTLYEMVGGVGGIVVLIFGNLFVIALEGFIVGIQALRLEFYEMFSRYYEGDGIQFMPISINKK